VVIATGDHAGPHDTRELISAKLGFDVDVTLPCLVREPNQVDVGRSTGLAVTIFSEYFHSFRPDLLIVLGDRFETYGASLAAYLSGIPIAHIHGGEKTVGSLDDSLRHSITKFAHFHFVAHRDYETRVIQLGEHPDSVHVVGGMGIDVIARTRLLEARSLTDELQFDVSEPFVMISLHAESNSVTPERAAAVVVDALRPLPDVRVLASLSGSDNGSDHVNDLVLGFATHRTNCRVVPNMGSRNFLSALRHAVSLVGNSSSGLLEAPALGTVTFNVGDRQRGRVRAPSVVDVGYDSLLLSTLIRESFVSRSKSAVPADQTFGDGGACKRIADHLQALHFPLPTKREFNDL